MDFDENGCYLFTIYDAGGNGIEAPPGFFVLFYGGSSQIHSGTMFGSSSSAQFDVGGTISIDEEYFSEMVNIFLTLLCLPAISNLSFISHNLLILKCLTI